MLGQVLGGQRHTLGRQIRDATMALPGCWQVTHQLYYFLDESRSGNLVALFTPSGSLFRQGELLIGHGEIMQAMLNRSTTQRIRHVISNGVIESQAQGCVNLVAYMTAYCFDDGRRHPGLVALSRLLRLSLVRVALQPTDEGWKITEISFTTEFEFVGDATPSGEVQTGLTRRLCTNLRTCKSLSCTSPCLSVWSQDQTPALNWVKNWPCAAKVADRCYFDNRIQCRSHTRVRHSDRARWQAVVPGCSVCQSRHSA
jgi:hypothetical protein